MRKMIVAASLVAVGFFGSAWYSPHTATACQEDQACWDCETMGNMVCGRVTVEINDNNFVQLWDEHDRIVFGPVLFEQIER